MSRQGARVIDLDEYRRRREAKGPVRAPVTGMPALVWVPVTMGGVPPYPPAQPVWMWVPFWPIR
jgi:hypothetical protein